MYCINIIKKGIYLNFLVFRLMVIFRCTKDLDHGIYFYLNIFCSVSPQFFFFQLFPHLMQIFALKLELRIILLCFEERESFVYHVVDAVTHCCLIQSCCDDNP